MKRQLWENAKQRADAYHTVFTGVVGERVLEDLKHTLYFYEPTHVKGDAYESAFREGMRAVALAIHNTVETAPSLPTPEEIEETDGD